MRIFDTHAHYDSGQFEEDRDQLIREIHDGTKALACAERTDTSAKVPVERIVNVGADMASSKTTLELAEKYGYIYAAVGVHPDSAGELIWCPEKCLEIKENVEDPDTDAPYKNITEEICDRNRKLIKNLAQQKKVVAIGEIGLDYHWDIWPRDIQKQAFKWQWELAKELSLPVIIHSRDAAEDTLNMMRSFYTSQDSLKKANCGNTIKDVQGERKLKNFVDIAEKKINSGLRAVMHCYSYSPEHAEEYLKMGLMFGIGGVVTFKNAKKLKEVVDMLPLERILLETDCPYMAPDPFRGKRNNSGYLTYVAEKIAEIKGIEAEEVYAVTYDNAKRFFDIQL